MHLNWLSFANAFLTACQHCNVQNTNNYWQRIDFISNFSFKVAIINNNKMQFLENKLGAEHKNYEDIKKIKKLKIHKNKNKKRRTNWPTFSMKSYQNEVNNNMLSNNLPVVVVVVVTISRYFPNAQQQRVTTTNLMQFKIQL